MREHASGRFLLRIDPALHAALRRAADEAGLSLNEYCARRLAAPGSDMSSPAAAVIQRAAAIAGSSLAAVAAFGSWVRGEHAQDSDVDVLIVLQGNKPIARSLYREWDREPMEWEGHSIEPHFVHLPAGDARVTSVWAEVAVDGVVLFERGFLLSRRLAAIRRMIAEGKIVRRYVNGQPYWVEAA